MFEASIESKSQSDKAIIIQYDDDGADKLIPILSVVGGRAVQVEWLSLKVFSYV